MFGLVFKTSGGRHKAVPVGSIPMHSRQLARCLLIVDRWRKTLLRVLISPQVGVESLQFVASLSAFGVRVVRFLCSYICVCAAGDGCRRFGGAVWP